MVQEHQRNFDHSAKLNMTVQNEEQLRELVLQADRASAAGNSAEATRLLSRAQELAPEHPLVLNTDGLQKLNSGDAAAALQLFERAIRKDDQNPSFWINLASTARRLKQPDVEMNALERALALDPRHLLALLQKASLLDLQGKPRAAASVYGHALQTIPPGAQLPTMLQAPLERAAEAVRANNAALESFLLDRLRPVRATHAGAAQQRFDHCLDTLLGKRAIYRPQPTFMYFPKVPAWEFYERDQFPWLDAIEAGTAEIRAEFARAVAEDAGDLEPYIAYPDGVPLDQWAELNRSRRWSAFYLYREGKPVERHLARCRKTAALLANAPQADVPGHGPNVFFSILDAKTRIPPHTGVSNTRLVVHLPLIIPPGCGFRVGSETRHWRAGTAWVFDDTIEHEAWNDSDTPRAILIFDIWNPYLSSAERDLVRTTTAGVGEYYQGQSPVSGLI